MCEGGTPASSAGDDNEVGLGCNWRDDEKKKNIRSNQRTEEGQHRKLAIQTSRLLLWVRKEAVGSRGKGKIMQKGGGA